MDSLNLRCLHYRHIKCILFTLYIKPALFTLWTHQHDVAYSIDHHTDVVYSMYTSNLYCAWHGTIKRMLITAYTYDAYVAYGMDISNLRFLQYGHTKLTLFTVWTYQTYVVYSMDTLILRCLQYGPIKLILLMGWTHQTYIAYSMEPSSLCSLLEYSHQT